MKPTIQSKALELIAREIGNIDSGPNLVKFLEECGVPPHLIEYPNTKWRMIDGVLNALSRSSSQADRGLLIKIIEQAAHPLMYGGDRGRAQEIQDKFSNYLEFDGYCMDGWKVVNANPQLLQAVAERQSKRYTSADMLNDLFAGIQGPAQSPQPQVQEVRIVGMPEVKIAKNEQEKTELDFDNETSTLYFNSQKITISQRSQSDAHDLLRTIFKDKTKNWSTDEVLDDWQVEVDTQAPKNKVYQAGKAVNRIVAQETTIKDFLLVTTKNIGINPHYLSG